MKKIIILLLFLSFSNRVFTQLQIGFRAGTFKNTIKAKADFTDVSAFLNNYIKATVGVVCVVPINSFLEVQSEINLSERASLLNFSEKYVLVSGESLRTNSFDLAILSKCNINIYKKIKLNICLGPALNYSASAKRYHIEADVYRYASDKFYDVDFKSEFNRITYGFQFGAAISAKLSGVEIFVDERYIRNLSSISKSENIKHQAFALTLGFLFDLKNQSR